MVKGVSAFHFEHNGICRGCSLGKNAKKTFPSSDKRSKGILDLIHSNTCEPMSRPSMGGCSYYVFFIDDFSCKTWIYFLKSKNETFIKFKEFKALVEKQTRRCIRALRTDNGEEFTSHGFDDFCRGVGIKRELTVPYNPQQNGVVERKNRSICEAAKAMMSDLDLPSSLWEKQLVQSYMFRIEALMLH
jgi:transposase InsO family protein